MSGRVKTNIWNTTRKFKAFFYSYFSYRNYDPYKRMREICFYKYKYMVNCPSELAKSAEEKERTSVPSSENVSQNCSV
jgi:hypothetical protein